MAWPRTLALAGPSALLVMMVLVLTDATRTLLIAEELSTLAVSATAQDINNRPIIGVLTLPGGEVARDLSYISAGYVKWLEAAGARVIPVMYDLSDQELKRVFGMINGLLIPGGNYPLKFSTRWFKTASILFQLAKDANDRGDFFPVHGTCLGMQLLVTLVCHDEYALTSVDAHDHPSRLVLTEAGRRSSFLSALPGSVLQDYQDHDIAMHNHFYGLLPQALDEYPELGSFFDVLATTRDRQGKEYVSIFDGKRYPFSGLAFHPEKVPYEWTTTVHLPHTRMAVDAAYFLAQAFVDRARLSSHRGQNVVEEDRHLIYNWSPRFSGRHRSPDDEAFFEQVYVFPRGSKYHSEGQLLAAEEVILNEDSGFTGSNEM